MTPEEFEKYFEIIQEDIFRAIGDGYYSIDDEKIRKQKLKQILEEIYKLGYQQCETDISNDDRYSLREDFEKGNI